MSHSQYNDAGGKRRRVEERKWVEGEVRLRQSGALSKVVVGRLIDSSNSGFRARHNCLNLTSGEVVEFELSHSRGFAQPVWTRLLEGEAETGFRILSRGGKLA